MDDMFTAQASGVKLFKAHDNISTFLQQSKLRMNIICPIFPWCRCRSCRGYDSMNHMNVNQATLYTPLFTI